MLPIKETFVSVQGEGYYAGTSSFFIRTQGCDIGCHWCDEPNSWDLNAGTSISLDHLLSKAKSNSIKNIIFTGGEIATILCSFFNVYEPPALIMV